MSQARGTFNLIQQAARQTGAKIPKPLADALAALDKADEAAAAVEPNWVALAASAVDAIMTGADPLEDTTVRRHLATVTLAVHPRLLSEEIDRRRLEAITEHVDAIIDSWRPVVERANAALAKAHEALPDADFTDPATIGNVPAALATTAAEARDALAKVQQIGQMWTVLGSTLGYASVPRDLMPLVTADLTAEQLDALPLSADHRTAGNAGHTLDLATFEDFHERMQTVTEQRDRRQAEHEQAQHREATKGLRIA